MDTTWSVGRHAGSKLSFSMGQHVTPVIMHMCLSYHRQLVDMIHCGTLSYRNYQVINSGMGLTLALTYNY